ncbi:MAG TPA: FAD-binding protein [Proteiniclasticum sp.]|jgi:NADPH-dependent 2,4-dienoyl-CoA reductase/sulfur reductase-like enzyme|uniref:Thioredoxin reductase n=1 Tax=Proteiniclasticum ruminis TaxID=398199 RepID=A0A1I4YV97_9CLOT|nr:MULTISPECIES: NAD(P)/FAD-dependent oxidoreductase [Proteiniclasticum]SFN41931.1 Thioredoxin reductase [Proteiniclasticum ruminis]HBW14168.1 FAD-binding protein [Proteiniclasticum sp.]
MIYDLIVIGGGPAGLSAAYEAYNNGIENILILERDKELGGILNQCIHNGFGVHSFKEELTGPEYAQRYVEMLQSTKVSTKLDTMVLSIENDGDIKKVEAINMEEGYLSLETRAIILSMGCRERTRGAIQIPGARPSGVFTAGTAQRYVNMEGYMVGKKVVILGSGDIGLIMARRMTLEGAKVEACVELMPYSNGLNRNIVQCLDDYNIPLLLAHTITDIVGKHRLEAVVIQKVDENRNPIPGTEQTIECDTLLLSVGLIPENEITKNAGIALDPRTSGPIVNEAMETNVKGIFACGNVVHVHDLVDFVSEEGKKAGLSASRFIKNELLEGQAVTEIKNGQRVNYTVPQKIRLENILDGQEIMFRVSNVFKNVNITVRNQEGELIKKLRRPVVAPGEMEKIKLKREEIEKANGLLTIALEEVM